jgi:hypothetical protein
LTDTDDETTSGTEKWCVYSSHQIQFSLCGIWSYRS